ncbi:MAG: GTP cyclohydrolase MptA [Halobacteriales archaeon]|nr:GTP cyclohydrolase MptA [Halobacteriales archaeon]
MGHQLPDVQASAPEVSVGLNRVGVTGVEKLLEIDREGQRPYVLMASFDVFVDLPGWRKGADMSRNMEVVDEIISEASGQSGLRIEEICGHVAERLLGRHDYTTQAEVEMEAEFAVNERTPASDRPTQSTATIIAGATATEAGTREKIGARVTGMTVCPCSQGMMAERARERLDELGVDEESVRAFLQDIPQAGHSQRGHATLAIASHGAPEVDLHDVIDVARDAMSARTYNLAKRPDEDHMTFHAHANARFVEDCVRAMASGVVATFDALPDGAVVTMKQSNDESIHQHNAHAERVAELGMLRHEMAD